MSAIEKNSEHYLGYEYLKIKTDGGRASLYIDAYASFGWVQDDNVSVSCKEEGSVLLCLKRDRKIMNRTELTRLQRNFEDCMNQIDALEQSKTKTGKAASITIGLIGTAFMTGSTFAVTAQPSVIWLCVLLAVPGFAGWLLPYFVYKTVVSKRTQKVDPLIEDMYDRAYEICEKGSRLLGKDSEKMGGMNNESGDL